MSYPDFASMTDGQLACALRDAEAKLLGSADTEAAELVVFAENEIADRLNLPPDETAQGFTPDAARRVDTFVEANS